MCYDAASGVVSRSEFRFRGLFFACTLVKVHSRVSMGALLCVSCLTHHACAAMPDRPCHRENVSPEAEAMQNSCLTLSVSTNMHNTRHAKVSFLHIAASCL